MWTPAKLENGQDARVFMHRYGFGWELADLRGRPTVGHGGASGTYILRFVDEPLSIIVLTNLESEERYPRLLAQAVAGAVRREYQPPQMLTPQPDPAPEVTRKIQAFVTDITMRRAPSVMSDAYAAWYNTAIGERAFMAKQLGGAGALNYLAHDELDGRSLWGSEPIARLVHYALDVKGRPYHITAGANPDGKVATFEFHAN